MNAKARKGFTIIEMVIVIAIIAILASVLVPTYRNVVDMANAGSALQSARASLNEWLSIATGSSGVPVAGNDPHGNYLSPVYFMAKQGKGVYQFRYNEGTVERTDGDAEKYVDFSALDQIEVYLTTPLEDPNFDPERYSAVIFRQEVQCRPDCPHREEHGPGDTYSNFYLLRRADSAYALGGADVVMLISGDQEFWVAAGMENFKDVVGGFYQDTALSGPNRVKGLTASVEKSVILTQYECRTFTEWNTSRYLVTFVKNADDANIASGFDADSHIGVNAATMPTATEISREGYTLIGWNTKSDGSGTQYAPGAVAEIHGEISFYAIWNAAAAPTPEKLTFTLLDGGTGYSVKAASTSISGEVVIPGTYEGLPVKEIDNLAFNSCTSLTSVTIPDSVTSIGYQAFIYCRSLMSITVSPDNSAYKSLDGVLHTIDGKTLIAYPGAKSGTYVIPDGITSIGYCAFSFCSSLTSITIPDSVTSIGGEAFAYCNGLTSIIIPDSVTSIGHYAFRDCSNLTSIAIPDSVTSIGTGAFAGCSSLTSITIPDGVTYISFMTFSGCSGLTSITIPDGVTSIDEGAFAGCSSLTGITVSPDNSTYKSLDGVLYTIDGKTLISYPDAKSGVYAYVIPDGVTRICNWAFDDCSSLTSVTIPDSVTSIGQYAFCSCISLTSITIPDSVTSIGDMAFFDCRSLGSIDYSGTIAQWNAISKHDNWHKFSPLTTIHCTDGDITL